MVEHDLAHIEHVLLRASNDVLESTALPPVYWRERLRQIRDGGQLLEPHLEKIDTLLLMLDRWLTSGPGNGRTSLAWDAAQQAKKSRRNASAPPLDRRTPITATAVRDGGCPTAEALKPANF
jgi:hypothetical protein